VGSNLARLAVFFVCSFFHPNQSQVSKFNFKCQFKQPKAILKNGVYITVIFIFISFIFVSLFILENYIKCTKIP
jgi:hypothetical protein